MEADELDKEEGNILIVLSAKCDKNGNLNSLRNVGSNQNSVIDIQLDSLNSKFQKKYVVLGENNEKWDRKDFIKIINEDWENSKSGYSLSLALREINPSGECWIIYSDILFRDLELNKFDKKDNLIFIDNEWENRFKDRKKRDDSLIELVKSDKRSSVNLFCTNNDPEIKGSSELCGIIKLTNKSFYDLKNTINSIKDSRLKELSTSVY